LETRTERVYHEVNGNPGISISGGRQFHYDLKNDTVYVTSGTVATQAISTEDIIKVLKATIGIDD